VGSLAQSATLAYPPGVQSRRQASRYLGLDRAALDDVGLSKHQPPEDSDGHGPAAVPEATV
jgi:hypothetical protein